jgi:hypothetical protein
MDQEVIDQPYKRSPKFSIQRYEVPSCTQDVLIENVSEFVTKPFTCSLSFIPVLSIYTGESQSKGLEGEDMID